MKIAIIHGSPHQGMTFECVSTVKAILNTYTYMTYEEIFLPQDAPCFCKGCYNCFDKGADHCPDARYIQPIVRKLENADGIIVSSPVYCMHISGALKALFDHLAFCYVTHKPRFFRHKAMVIVTSAASGETDCIKYIRQNLSLLGIDGIVDFGKAMNARNWQNVSEKIKKEITNELKVKTGAFYKAIESKKNNKPTFSQSIKFEFSKAMVQTKDWHEDDRIFWKEHGWLNKSTDYYIQDSPANYLGKLTGKLMARLLLND